jgi:hypothetical protein
VLEAIGVKFTRVQEREAIAMNNCFAIEVEKMWGDADRFATLQIAQFPLNEGFKLLRYKTLFSRMQAIDLLREGGSYQDYDHLPTFESLLPKWESDDIHDGFVRLKRYWFFFYDEVGNKQEILPESHDPEELHYYLQVDGGKSIVDLYQILITDEPLSKRMCETHHFVHLTNPSPFMEKYNFISLTEDLDDYYLLDRGIPAVRLISREETPDFDEELEMEFETFVEKFEV